MGADRTHAMTTLRFASSFPLRASRGATPSLALAAALACLCAPASAQTAERPPAARVAPPVHNPPAAALASVRDALASHVLYDEPGGGALWARGTAYKASFDAAGATFYPFLGSRAPRDYPHALSADRVSVGGEPLASAPAGAAHRDADHVVVDRGAFSEVYDLGLESLEQSFVFDELPSRGELVLHVPLAAELPGVSGVATDAGLEFANESGAVRYGRATAIDALGRHVEAPLAPCAGGLEIRVPADFVARAALPLTIDPVVGTIIIDSTTDDTLSPDVAWDPTQQSWLVVWEKVFSSVDSDVFAASFTGGGTPIANLAVDLSGASWQAPRCANLAAAQQFLCVAAVTSGTIKKIMGRTIEPAGTILVGSSQFDIGTAGTGNKIRPDVGGDPYPSSPSYYCVVYEQDFTSGDPAIAYRLVAPDTSLLGSGPTYFPTASGVKNYVPGISKSDDTSSWLVAWQADSTFSFGDLLAARVHWDGVLLDSTFGVTSGTLVLDTYPSCSSRLEGSGLQAIAFQRTQGLGGVPDIGVCLLDGTSVVKTVNLTALENSGQQGVAQTLPSIDSDGQHLLVGYSEYDSAFHHDNVFVSDLYVSGTEIGLAQSHQILFDIGQSERRVRISAQHGSAQPTGRYLAMFDAEQNSVDHDVLGYLFDTFTGGSWSAFCPGDGSQAPCPCGNSGASGHGCANSTGNGALLELTGVPSTLDDSAVLQVSGVPNGKVCLFFQGTVDDPPTPVGDGLLCTKGTITRLIVRSAAGGTVRFPSSGDPALSSAGMVPLGGGLRTYQVWYRDSASTCTGAGSNLSNGVVVDWAL